jgi:hypothetical protein
MKVDHLPTKDEFDAWLDHPMTRMFKSWAEKRKSDLKDHWAAGMFTDETDVKMITRNIGAIGECQMADRFINLDYEQFVGDMSDD